MSVSNPYRICVMSALYPCCSCHIRITSVSHPCTNSRGSGVGVEKCGASLSLFLLFALGGCMTSMQGFCDTVLNLFYGEVASHSLFSCPMIWSAAVRSFSRSSSWNTSWYSIFIPLGYRRVYSMKICSWIFSSLLQYLHWRLSPYCFLWFVFAVTILALALVIALHCFLVTLFIYWGLLGSCWFFTQGQFSPAGIVVACVCVSVSLCVNHLRVRDNSGPVQARIT